MRRIFSHCAPPSPQIPSCVSSRVVEAKKRTTILLSIAQIQVSTLNLKVAGDYVGYCWPLMGWLIFLKNPVSKGKKTNSRNFWIHLIIRTLRKIY